MITEHDMLVTIATMALKMGDLTGHDILESLRALGYGHVINRDHEPRKPLIKSAAEAFTAAIEECQTYAQKTQDPGKLEAAQQIAVRIAMRARAA